MDISSHTFKTANFGTMYEAVPLVSKILRNQNFKIL